MKRLSLSQILILVGIPAIISCSPNDSKEAAGTIKGCTDATAKNYNPEAKENDSSCIYQQDTIDPVHSQNLPEKLSSTSGLLFDDRHQLVTFNDHKDTHLYHFNPKSPDEYSTDFIPGVKNRDWEEVQQDHNYFYIGDIGNNVSGNRKDLKFYRVEKSEIGNNPKVEKIKFSYNRQTDFSKRGPNQTDFDAEAFIVTDNSIYIFTKEWISGKTSVYELEKKPGKQVAHYKESFDVKGLVTGAAYLEDKNLIALSGYSKEVYPFVYLLYDYKDHHFFKGKKRKLFIDCPFHQVEGIASEDGLHYYISNEALNLKLLDISVRQQVHKIDLSSFLSDYIKNQ